MRVQGFNKTNAFFLGAILGLASDFNKKIELNIWVDKDLDVDEFVRSFKP